MYIVEVIQDMLMALGLLEGGLIAGVLALVAGVAVVAIWILKIGLAWALISAAWTWVKRLFYWIARKEMPEEEGPLGTKTAKNIKKWLNRMIDDLAEKELRSK